MTDKYIDAVDSDTNYYVRCSDCESQSDDYLSPEQAATSIKRDGWRFYGQRLLCFDCAHKYPDHVLSVE